MLKAGAQEDKQNLINKQTTLKFGDGGMISKMLTDAGNFRSKLFFWRGENKFRLRYYALGRLPRGVFSLFPQDPPKPSTTTTTTTTTNTTRTTPINNNIDV